MLDKVLYNSSSKPFIGQNQATNHEKPVWKKHEVLFKALEYKEIVVATPRTSRVAVVCFEMYAIKAMTV